MDRHHPDNEPRDLSLLSPDERYDYFVEKVAAWGEVWSLQSEQGWVTMTSEDGEECLPVWPSQELAAEWATDEWSDCAPTGIALDVWLQRWTAGLEKDGTLLAVFPDNDGEGSIVTPRELAASIEAELRLR